jgi:protoporphyrinogen oxidase
MHKKAFDTAILGGGFSGMYLALLLQRAGQTVVVLEKEKFLGGLLRTISHKGFRFDLGGHRLVFRRDKDLKDFLAEIGHANPLINNKRRAKIYLTGRFLNYPPMLAEAFKLPQKLWLPIIRDFIKGKINLSYPKTFEQWICRQYGETIYRLVFKDYTRKVWGMDCTKISPYLLKERVGRFFFFYSLLGLKSVHSKDTKNTFHYTQNGIEEIIEAIRAQLNENVSLFTAAKVKGITTVQGVGPQIFTEGEDGKEYVFEAKSVVSTVPVSELIKVLDDRELMPLLPNFRTRHVMFLNLMLKKGLEELPPFHWLYLPQGDVIFSRAYMPGVWSKFLVPEGRHSLSMEVICGDDLFALPQEDAIALCFDNLSRTGLKISKSDIEDHIFLRQANAYPVIENKSIVDEGKKQIKEKYPFVHLLGRAGNHAYYDVEECVCDARRLADVTLENHHKRQH